QNGCHVASSRSCQAGVADLILSNLGRLTGSCELLAKHSLFPRSRPPPPRKIEVDRTSFARLVISSKSEAVGTTRAAGITGCRGVEEGLPVLFECTSSN